MPKCTMYLKSIRIVVSCHPKVSVRVILGGGCKSTTLTSKPGYLTSFNEATSTRTTLKKPQFILRGCSSKVFSIPFIILKCIPTCLMLTIKLSIRHSQETPHRQCFGKTKPQSRVLYHLIRHSRCPGSLKSLHSRANHQHFSTTTSTEA